MDTQINEPSVEEVVAVTEVKVDVEVGEYIGICKWFNDKFGYGFITVRSGDKIGTDIFVHYSGLMPANSNYKTLKKGEYISFNIIDGKSGPQAVDVRGIGGGPLMCDSVSARRITTTPVHDFASSSHEMQQTHRNWQTVSHGSKPPPRKQTLKYSKETRKPYVKPVPTKV